MANGANKKPRIEGDAYFTPGKPVRQILQVLRRDVWRGDRGLSGLRVLEPSCGAGNILTEVIGFGGVLPENCTGIDIADHPRGPHLAGCAFVQADFLQWVAGRSLDHIDLVIGNPPYEKDLPAKFVEAILSKRAKCQPVVVALLMRLAWLASDKRAAMHRKYPPSVYVLSERPSFTGNGRTDGADYAWFVWQTWPTNGDTYGKVEVLGTEDPGQLGLF